ncbi:MAG TPA: hypoxanthine phosphoribosyltransferase [Bacillota bacterium]|nr:hypoxanthine phosphoribosyltransferase [Bacillota bacterium]
MAKVIDDIERVLVDEKELDATVRRIASEIDEYYKDSVASGKKLLLLGILKGSVVFMGDLMKHVTLPVEIDFMKVSSYGRSAKSSGTVNIILDLFRDDLPQTDILVIEDIIDSGRTLSYLTEYLTLKGAHSVRTCTLLDKPQRREVDFNADHVGIIIPDEFVVGYGLDYAERYRTLPYIGVLKPEIYKS